MLLLQTLGSSTCSWWSPEPEKPLPLVPNMARAVFSVPLMQFHTHDISAQMNKGVEVRIVHVSQQHINSSQIWALPS